MDQPIIDSIIESVIYLSEPYDEEQLIAARFNMQACIDCGEIAKPDTMLQCQQCERVMYWWAHSYLKDLITTISLNGK